MTKEEIVAALLNDWEIPYLQDWQAREIVDFIIKNYTPSLPSNLNEAAEEYELKQQEIYKDKDNHDFNNYRDGFVDGITHTYEAFKAGAEWLAGQGVSIELKVKEDAGGYPYIDKHIELYDYDTDTPLAKNGDKVVVQIRKK